METKARTLFHQAVELFKRGDREAAREVMRQSILADAKYAPAWLWMSALVPDIQKQRECLLRVLEFEPNNEHAKKGLELLRLQESSASMAVAETIPHDEGDGGQGRARRLGEYLIEHGCINTPQLEQALAEQKRLRSSFQGVRIPLGDVLIKLGMLTPDMLAGILLEQQEDKIGSTIGQTPEYLGEYLVSKGVISRDQLVHVLAEQTRQRQAGNNMLLGELLLRAGYITSGALDPILEQQREDVFRRFYEE